MNREARRSALGYNVSVKFKLHTPYQPTGDQPTAIKQLVKSIKAKNKHQTLLGVTGSGKTFTMANIIEQTQKPTLVMAHNKTLAAQLYQEFRDYFPENAVSYFVSYYDYYQPEAYLPSTDTYIEKEADINDEIDKLRLAATTNLLTRKDVIVVASVSSIYNIGPAEGYDQHLLQIVEGEILSPDTLFGRFSDIMYDRTQTDLRRGTYRVRGDTIQIWPADGSTALTIEMLGNKITNIREIDPVSGILIDPKKSTRRNHNGRYQIFPARHYNIEEASQEKGIKEIEHDLAIRLKELQDQGKILEAHRLKQKVSYDMEMIREFGFVNGIENYSRHFDGRNPGDPPNSLLGYFELNRKRFNKDSFLTIVDESHMSLPQIRGMYRGDQARKSTLIDYGFRLPSALDNRPLRFPEFLEKTQQNLYVSATPADWELEKAGPEHTAEQLIRPTGLIDPIIELRPIENQVEDLVIEVIRRKQMKQRVLVTTLTKKMAEALTDYLNTPEKITQLIKAFNEKDENLAGLVNGTNDNDSGYQQSEILPIDEIEVEPLANHYYKRLKKLDQIPDPEDYPKVMYLHSDIETLERSDILDDLRRGEYDVLVGINLLREGLDLPEVGLVAILDADKEGFLRSKTSMVQTMGRAARHEDGRALLFADKMTKSMKAAISETQRRREFQVAHNLKHNISPAGISKPIREKLLVRDQGEEKYGADGVLKNTSEIGKKRNRSGKTHRQKDVFAGEKPQGSIVELKKGEKIDLSKINPEALTPVEKDKLTKKLKRRMQKAANDMDYELAAMLRDKIEEL